MTFDPLKFYEDEQRKQKRYDSLFPVFLVAIVLFIAYGAAFVAYQRSHEKPVQMLNHKALSDKKGKP
jgi:hypothetical protein